MMIYILPFFFTLFLLWKLYYTSTTTTAKNPPPSPPKLPIIGNLHQLGPLIHRSFASLSDRYGGRHLMLLHLGSIPTLVVSSAAAAHEIMQTHDLIFATRPPIQIYNTLFYNLKEISAAPYGEYWRQAKKLMMINLLSTTKVQKLTTLRNEEVAVTLRKISESRNALNLRDLLFEHSNAVACRTTFGKKYDSNKLKKVMSSLLVVLTHFYYADSIPQLGWIDRVTGANGKVEAVAKEIDELMETAVEERVAETDGVIGEGEGEGVEVEPLIDALLRAQKHGVDGISFDRDALKALLSVKYS